MRRIGTWAAAIVLGAGALAGCGGDDSSSAEDDGGSGGSDSSAESSDYCDRIDGFADTLMGSGSAQDLEDLRTTAEELADDAPDEVSAEWGKIRDAFNALDDKLEEAGLSLEDLQDPTALSAEQQQALVSINEDLVAVGEEVGTAGQTISEHAETECGVQLGGGAEPSDPSSGSPSS